MTAADASAAIMRASRESGWPGGDIPADEATGYAHAFYEIGKMLGLPAMAMSPRRAWETEMRPRLAKLTGREPTQEDIDAVATAISLSGGGNNIGADWWVNEARSAWNAVMERLHDS